MFREGQQSSDGSGAQALQGVAEGTGISQSGKRRCRGDLTVLYSSLEGGYGEVRINLFYVASNSTRGNGLKLH